MRAEDMFRSVREAALRPGLVGSTIARLDQLGASDPIPTVVRPPVARPRPKLRARVSVIVPCYNYGRFLDDCVSSALMQKDVAIEVIVVDDASTDDSLETARRFGVDR